MPKRMTRFFFFLCFLWGNYLFSQAPDQTDLPTKTYALIIGISDYTHLNGFNSIPFADSDAKTFANFLLESGNVKTPEDVVLLINEQATLEETMTQLSILQVKAGLQKSRVIIFFAGHSYIEGNSMGAGNISFLLSDTPEDFIWNQSLRYKSLQGILASLSIEHNADVFLFLDSAHADDRDMMGTIGRQLDAPFTKEVKILSTLPGQLSLELPQMDEGHRLFAYYLLRGMEGEADRDLGNGDGKVEAGELESFLTDNMGKHSRGNQYPLVVGDGRKVVAMYDPDPFSSGKKTRPQQKELKASITQSTYPIKTQIDPCDLNGMLTNTGELSARFREAVRFRGYFAPPCNNAAYYYQKASAGVEKEIMRARFTHALNQDAGSLLKQYQADLLQSVPVSTVDTVIGRLSMILELSEETEVGYNMILSRKFFLSGISEARKVEADLDPVIQQFEKAIQLDLYSSCAYHAAAVLYRRKGLDEKADEYLNMVKHLSPLWQLPEEDLLIVTQRSPAPQVQASLTYPAISPFAPQEKDSQQFTPSGGNTPNLISTTMPSVVTNYVYPQVSRRNEDAQNYGFYWIDPAFREGYTIQVGAFKDYENALIALEQLKALTDQHCMMHVKETGEAPVFRLLTGNFTEPYKSEGMQAFLKEKGLETVVVAFGDL